MKKEEIKAHMDEIIRLTFERLGNAYKNQEVSNSKFENVGSRLVFPSYYNKDEGATETRISEQELRFTFVEAFNAYCDLHNLALFYSVETPTMDTYSNFANSKKKPTRDDDGRSAEFDLVIFDEQRKRRCLVEFKANNASKHDHWKDFVKLNNPNEDKSDVLSYFIEVIKSYTDNGEHSTVSSLNDKIKNHLGNISFHCYALEGKSKRSGTGKIEGEIISDKITKL